MTWWAGLVVLLTLTPTIPSLAIVSPVPQSFIQAPKGRSMLPHATAAVKHWELLVGHALGGMPRCPPPSHFCPFSPTC